MKTTHYKTAKDKNGNKVLRITPDTGRGFSIQTLGNLPSTHRDGVGAWTAEEVAAHVGQHGTDKQRVALGLPPRLARYFIQRRDGRNLETVDEFADRKEARAMLAEYRMADPSAGHYISTRPCRDWSSH